MAAGKPAVVIIIIIITPFHSVVVWQIMACIY